ncbi:MAG: AAA family ATPase [Pirellulales bacterium]|nr:AAA family ATPase [Pirellulales bacterium]
MYESYWQLRQKPFENGADPAFFYPGPSHQAALLKLRYALENRRDAALLVGGSGLGKTLLVTMLQAIAAEPIGPVVRVSFPQMPLDELMAYLAVRLTGASWSGRTPGLQESVGRIETFLTSNAQKGRHAVVVIEEAHLIDDPRTLEAIRLLSNFEPGGRPGLTVLLSAQPGFLPVLDRTPQLEERLAVKCLLRPLSEKETAEYVAHRLEQAGAKRPLFEPKALPILAQLTQGVPRRINRLCDLALLIGYAEQQKTLGPDQLEAVSQELAAVAAD